MWRQFFRDMAHLALYVFRSLFRRHIAWRSVKRGDLLYYSPPWIHPKYITEYETWVIVIEEPREREKSFEEGTFSFRFVKCFTSKGDVKDINVEYLTRDNRRV